MKALQGKWASLTRRSKIITSIVAVLVLLFVVGGLFVAFGPAEMTDPITARLFGAG